MDNILKQLTEIKNELHKPFPYTDTDKIQKDFRKEFNNLSDDEDSLTADFNTYCVNIAGTLSYVLTGKINKIPQDQIEMLQKTFFGYFKQYKFFEDKIEIYNDFSQEYKNFEQTRKLLLCLLSK
ncbi:YxiJ family protein [Rummeliibacillus pycnus]|uniref:YxiJ family protein n=1 Tax=Rummeliibacillus pycnus TaxID=101070 RepID=UPI003D265BF6